MMIEYLEEIDRSIVQLINGWNSPFLDELMWFVSAKATWFPFYFLVLFLVFRQSGIKKAIVFLLSALIAVGISDLSSVHLFKEVFQRYRPSHNLLITDTLHYYSLGKGDFYKGGTFGFISSHAANFVALCTISFLVLRKSYPKSWVILAFLVALVSYSRIYLGVHYLSDVFVGSLLGFLVGYLVHRFVFIPIIERDFFNK